MEQLLGRCYVPKEGVVKYLVSYEGYFIGLCWLYNRLMDGS